MSFDVDRRGASHPPRVPVAEPRRLRRPAAFLRPAVLSVEGNPNVEVLARDATARRLLAAADGLSAILAFVLCVAIVGNDALHLTAFAVIPMAILASKVVGLYDRDEIVLHKSTLDEAPALFQLATTYTLLMWLLEGVLIDGQLGRGQVIGLWAALFLLLLLGRWSARALGRRITAPERCLAVGEANACEGVRRKLADTHRLNAEVIAQMPLVPRRVEDLGRGERTWTPADLDAVARRFGVHRVMIVPGAGEGDETLDLVRAAKALGLKVSVVPRVFEVIGSQIEFDDLGGMPILGVRRFVLSRSSAFLKRALDLVGAVVGLLAMAPVSVLIALAIKLDSRGPVFYHSPRIGRNGRHIDILKFRTMVKDADRLKADLHEHNEADGLFKIADDPRITRVGRMLRRSSLDELPQLLNVLRGEMSLVGPRPLVREEDERVQGWHRRRLELTPGMTGVWQILGSARIPLHEMVKIDYLYVASWSLWKDVKILLRTVPYMLRRRGL